MNAAPRKFVRFLADEFHSESWSLSAQRAAEFAREDPQSSSYSRAAAGLRIENTRVFDRSACVPGNPEWLFAEPAPGSPLAHLAARACFYRAGSCTVTDGARAAWRASAQAHPAHACLVGCAELGLG